MIVSASSLLDQFVHSLATRDFAALESTFAPDVHFRALLPPGLREAHTRSEAGRLYHDWFAAPHDFDMVGHTIVPVGSRTHVAYRLHFVEDGMRKLCEHRIFVTTGPNGIEHCDLVDSGSLPRPD
jgi:hypothetical protein